MFKIDTTRRSKDSEIMDDFELSGSELRRTLKDLDNINSWLGGNQITVKGVNELVNSNTGINNISIVDIGCGNGAMLRKLAKWGNKKNLQLELIGIDANPHAIAIGKELSSEYKNISFEVLNIFSEEFKQRDFDIILCTLTLHHFKDKEITNLLKQLYNQANYGIVVNDLHRNKLAYILFKAFCAVFVNNEIARKDGLTSILRGFKRADLNKYIETLPVEQHSINWRWAFRYQWIIKK